MITKKELLVQIQMIMVSNFLQFGSTNMKMADLIKRIGDGNYSPQSMNRHRNDDAFLKVLSKKYCVDVIKNGNGTCTMVLNTKRLARKINQLRKMNEEG